MNKLSEAYEEIGIQFKFPIVVRDKYGYELYYESETGFHRVRRYDSDGNQVYYWTSSAGVIHDEGMEFYEGEVREGRY